MSAMSMPTRSSPWLSLGVAPLAAGLCFVMLSLMALTHVDEQDKPKKELIVRPVVVRPPPPPPPRNTTTQPTRTIVLPQLKTSQAASAVVLPTPPVDVPLQLDFNPQVAIDTDLEFNIDMELDSGTELLSSFKFEDLDQAPRLLHHGGFRFQFPRELLRRNILQGRVDVEIEIDESGGAIILRVVSATHPSLIEIAKRMVSLARFSKPTVQGRPTKTTGIWPVVLNAPSKKR